jgi:hypothetical protein
MLPFLLTACSPTYYTSEYLDQGNPMAANLTQSATTTLQTTTNQLGSFVGNKITGLNINNLEPGEYTIEFSVVEAPIDPEDFAVYAYVHWKVESQQLQRIISVFSGAVISGVADSVDVQLLDQSGRGTFGNTLPNASVTNGSPTVTFIAPFSLAQGQTIVFLTTPPQSYEIVSGVTNSTTVTLSENYQGVTDGNVTAYSIASYKVGATLSRGSRPTIMQPPTLATLQLLQVDVPVPPAPSVPQVVPIPQDAGIISVLTTVVATTGPQSESLNGRVTFSDKTGLFFIGAYVPNYFSGWYPVPAGAASMSLHSDSASATLLFGIQWGIEG